ncbi:MAG: copper chaperone PCu(A)C [Rhodobacteraceae bacterium]|nr:MAG: copper chaperone PCu(A)C [Paracoccaceae bacterium]
MTLIRLSAALAATLLAAPVLAADIAIEEAYARASNTKAGAAFMMIRNTGARDDRLLAAASDAAVRVELHTHKDMGDGVMKMMEVEEGFAIPGGGMHALARGGDHIMFMGLTAPFEQGKTVTVTLTFEQAGEMVVEIPVDLERQPDHGAMSHGN